VAQAGKGKPAGPALSKGRGVGRLRRIRLAVQAHEHFRSRALNLQASENLLSPAARAALASDMASRYSLRLDTEFEVEEEARSLAREVFRARFALIEPIGGHVAAMVALLATTKRGGLIASCPQKFGGYTGYDGKFMPEMFGMLAGEWPFKEKSWNLDIAALPGFLKKTKPSTLVLGASYLLFPYDMGAVRDACTDARVRPTVLYDGSHVMGLIAGGRFQAPLAEGAHVLFGSTHKSFFGPQGGVLFTNDEDLDRRARENLTWRTMDNAHENRIAALAIALAEMQHFGASYAHRVVELAQSLGKALDDRGVPVRFRDLGFTQSHQLLLDERAMKKLYGLDTAGFSAELGQNSLIVDAVGRIGTAELARCGAQASEMEELARLIHRAAKGTDVKAQVEEFKSHLPAPAFVFD
jgi:glycine hydroxymethyltransferase